MNRRRFALNLLGTLMAAMPAFAGASAATTLRKEKSEWKALLPAERYAVLFEDHTEPPFSSPLDAEKRDGTFICAACFQPLFNARHKYDSGTGWPSFFDTLPGSIGTRKDYAFIILPRTEYHCARCGGHQGHVFEDGPRPTGLRYCNNGLALQFVARTERLPALRA